MRDWSLEIPEVVNISINTPYPGTETWHTESRRLTTRDYRLFDIQHAVLPTKLPLGEFYKELVEAPHPRLQTLGLEGAARVCRHCRPAIASWSDQFPPDALEIQQRLSP